VRCAAVVAWDDVCSEVAALWEVFHGLINSGLTLWDVGRKYICTGHYKKRNVILGVIYYASLDVLGDEFVLG